MNPSQDDAYSRLNTWLGRGTVFTVKDGLLQAECGPEQPNTPVNPVFTMEDDYFLESVGASL